MQANSLDITLTDEGLVPPTVGASATVEPEELSRFEGEGGPEAPIPELADVPLDGADWRRPRWVSHQTNEKKKTT